jgi:hypothetical protein
MADTDGRLMQGDQILAVNEEDVANCMQEDVATILKVDIKKRRSNKKLGEGI